MLGPEAQQDPDPRFMGSWLLGVGVNALITCWVPNGQLPSWGTVMVWKPIRYDSGWGDVLPGTREFPSSWKTFDRPGMVASNHASVDGHHGPRFSLDI